LGRRGAQRPENQVDRGPAFSAARTRTDSPIAGRVARDRCPGHATRVELSAQRPRLSRVTGPRLRASETYGGEAGCNPGIKLSATELISAQWRRLDSAESRRVRLDRSCWGPGGRRFKSCLPDLKRLQMANVCASVDWAGSMRGSILAGRRRVVFRSVERLSRTSDHPVRSPPIRALVLLDRIARAAHRGRITPAASDQGRR
jgi:hypothetical protein